MLIDLIFEKGSIRLNFYYFPLRFEVIQIHFELNKKRSDEK